jgi:hypothetical protein
VLAHDKTADKAPAQAEMAKAGRAGRAGTTRGKLRRIVQAAAAAARTDSEFFAAIEARGALARPRWSMTRPGEITGCPSPCLATRPLTGAAVNGSSGLAAGSSRPTSRCLGSGSGGPGCSEAY